MVDTSDVPCAYLSMSSERAFTFRERDDYIVETRGLCSVNKHTMSWNEMITSWGRAIILRNGL